VAGPCKAGSLHDHSEPPANFESYDAVYAGMLSSFFFNSSTENDKNGCGARLIMLQSIKRALSAARFLLYID